MSFESSTWCRLFSPTLEDWILSDPPSKALEKKILPQEIEAWNMWIYKTHGIMPNQYHHFYEQGETMLYQEHIQDLMVIDTIWANKMKMMNNKAKSKQHAKNNPLTKNTGGLGFYGQTYRYDR